MDDAVPDLNMPPVPERQVLFADEARLIVKRVTMPDGLPESVLGGIVSDWWGVDVTAAEAAHHVKAVVWNEDEQIFEAHVLQERRTEFDWGASAGTATWIVEVMQTVSVQALTAGMLYAIHKIRGSRAERFMPEPLTIDVATDKARQSVALIYDLDAETLKLVGDSRSSDGHEIRISYIGENGKNYWARVTLLGGLYLTAEVGCSDQ